MSQEPVHLTEDDVDFVLSKIKAGRIRDLDGVLYDPNMWEMWNGEPIRDWLERTHLPRRAH